MTGTRGTGIMKRLSRVAIGTSAACMCVPALARQGLGDVANTPTGQITDPGQLIGATAVLVGIGMPIMSAIKFRACSTNSQDPSASVGGAAGWLAAGRRRTGRHTGIPGYRRHLAVRLGRDHGYSGQRQSAGLGPVDNRVANQPRQCHFPCNARRNGGTSR